ncbi:MAG: CoA pyrophosphatase [Candidatus Dadabacteria bacterium]
MPHHVIEELERIIKERKSIKIIREENFIHASVMVILREEGGRYSMLFIKRREYLSDLFSGHMAFPGGKMQKGDENKLETAIRETLEETGIDLRKDGRIIGELDDVSPVNPRARHYIVTPYVALVGGDIIKVKPNEEVAEFVWIPLSNFMDEKTLEIRVVERYGIRLEDFAFHYQKYVIWGMTARVLHQFLSLAGYLFSCDK